MNYEFCISPLIVNVQYENEFGNWGIPLGMNALVDKC